MMSWLKAAERATEIEIVKLQARLATLQQARSELDALIDAEKKATP